MNFKGILFFLGFYSLFLSLFSFLNILYSFYFTFNLDLHSYVFSLLLTFFVGLLFCFIGRKSIKDISFSEQILLILIAFIFLPLLISFPYFLSSYDISFINAYFESVSGFTSTGFSVITNVEALNEPLILWRSSSQWIGGLFFLIATIGTLGSKRGKLKPAYLISSEFSQGNFYNHFHYNFLKILSIYFFSTILIILLFKLSNIRFFESVNLAFTTISSGGFISSNDLSKITNSNFQKLILSLSLLIPIFNFYLLFKVFSGKFNIREHQEDLHLLIIIIVLTLFFYFLILPTENIFDIILSIISSISTSGISTYSSDFDVSLFFILMTIIGGSLISNSSGFKYIRFYILLKNSYHEIYRLVKPINIFNRTLFNTGIKIQEDDFKISFLVFISFIIGIFVLSGILTLNDLNFESAFKLAILTLTNTTTSELYGMENLSFFDLNSFTKVVLMSFMILGKIEIIAGLFLLKKFIFRE